MVGQPRYEQAGKAWQSMIQFSLGGFLRGLQVGSLREVGITPGHFKVLTMLDQDDPKPMRVLADQIACDASQLTWLVDRLEEKGLVQRRSLAGDRRVKTIAITKAGIELREQLLRQLFEPPPQLLELDEESLRILNDILSKIPLGSPPPFGGVPIPTPAD